MKEKLIFPAAIFLGIALLGCADNKKDEPVIPRTGVAPTQQAAPSDQKPQLPPSHPPIEKDTPMAGSPHGGSMQKSEKKVVVPDSVKKSWSKVRLQFADRQAKSSKDIVVPVGGEVSIEGTSLKVKVGEFLPEFSMTGGEITSRSNEPKQPAVRVEIYEQGKLVHKGWLFARMPDVHAFEHPKYALTLKEGVK